MILAGWYSSTRIDQFLPKETGAAGELSTFYCSIPYELLVSLMRIILVFYHD
jgi:hypothetical protein